MPSLCRGCAVHMQRMCMCHACAMHLPCMRRACMCMHVCTVHCALCTVHCALRRAPYDATFTTTTAHLEVVGEQVVELARHEKVGAGDLRRRLEPIGDFYLRREVRAVDLVRRAQRPLDRPAKVQPEADARAVLVLAELGMHGGQVRDQLEGLRACDLAHGPTKRRERACEAQGGRLGSVGWQAGAQAAASPSTWDGSL